ncbi:leucyl aminopeptidase [Pseudoruegeria sp. HB172150]|uniref:leucyl aminopeptidase n=1 Tax=Pseudoruegeria sp. HB172150 TaxID=2721164 RepID=UPI0015572E45|nr:leucyl aminopeptidase [Pseudoruegeria sp. HB172150]
MATQYEMVKVFTQQLELCGVKPHETLIVLSEGDIRKDYAEATLLAAREMGVSCFQLNLPLRETRSIKSMTGRTGIAGNLPAIEALKKADIVIDFMGMLFSHEQNEICATGTRVCFIREPFDILCRNMPNKDLRRRVEWGEKLLKEAKVMRITSDVGTDVTYELGDYPVMTQYGYTDTPGRWDHMGTGQVLTNGNDGHVNGVVVLQAGDIVNGFKRYLESEVRLTIKDGFITDIEGPGMDAALIRKYIESYNDPRAYAISHIGWGLLDSAPWYHNIITRTKDQEIGTSSLSYYGNVLFSTGPNTELGGKNDTACHMDMPMRDCSLSLDGVPIVEKGKVVVPEMVA